MNAYLNERYMLCFDAHYGKHVRSFVELKGGLNSYRIGSPRPIDEKKLDFQAAFLEVGTGDERMNRTYQFVLVVYRMEGVGVFGER